MADIDDATDAGPDPRLIGLRRMQFWATATLVAMAVLFVAAGVAKRRWPWFAYVQAFGEAGMVGACADWFAVTALFRRPFGLPIPHTGILPRNQARIGATVGAFVVSNFLTDEVVTRKLKEIDVALSLARWLSRPENARRVARRAAPVVAGALTALPSEDVKGMVATLARQGAESVPAAPLAAHLLAALWDQGHGQTLLDQGLEQAHAYLVRRKDDLKPAPGEALPRWMPRWLDRALTKRALDSLARTLADMRRPDHPWRADVREAVKGLIVRLATDPDAIARGEAIKIELLESRALARRAGLMWSNLQSSLKRGETDPTDSIAQALAYALNALGLWLADDPQVQRRANAWVRRVVRDAVVPRRAEIGDFISEVVMRWDTETLIRKIELEVGRDLQYVRINGALVGGLVGLVIYAAARALGFS